MPNHYSISVLKVLYAVLIRRHMMYGTPVNPSKPKLLHNSCPTFVKMQELLYVTQPIPLDPQPSLPCQMQDSQTSIIFMLDHKCEESLKTYCRRPSTAQKEMISNVLEHVASGMSSDKNLPLVKSVIPAAAGSASVPVVMPLPSNVLAMNQQAMWSSQMSSFATNSSFNNCHFHLYANNSNTGS